MASKDKDFRYMAASDLQSELAKDGFQVEGDSEQRLVQAVLQQLEDPSGDISALGVKWCPPRGLLCRLCLTLNATLAPTRHIAVNQTLSYCRTAIVASRAVLFFCGT